MEQKSGKIKRPRLSNLVKYPADEQHGKTIVNGVSRIGYMTGGHSARWKDETIPYQMLHKARTFIDQNRDNPFFIYFSFHDIHVPYMADIRFQGFKIRSSVAMPLSKWIISRASLWIT